MTSATKSAPRPLTPYELAGVVRAFRAMRGWSQEQLAEICGLNARTVQRVEDGESSSLDTRRALARAFGFDDIDAFNKPYTFPTAEEIAAEKARFEAEHVTLKAVRVENGKQLATQAAGASAWLFSEGVDLARKAQHAFAELSDYCREYGDCSELYSATDRLDVYEQIDVHLKDLHEQGVVLAMATRSAMFRSQPSAPGVRMDILYVVAFHKDKVPENFAVKRQVQFA